MLGLLVVALTILALRQRRHRLVSLALLGLTVFLAVIGIRSNSLHDPGVVMGNIAGGFAMLGLLGWLYFRLGSRNGHATSARAPRLTPVVVLAVITLAVQILLGGFTSANFAATACRTLPDCHGSYWPGTGLMTALDLSRHHEVTASGQAIGGPERLAIHKAHRIGAVLALALALAAATLALRAGHVYRPTAVFIATVALAEFVAGIASVLSGLPITLALAHNSLAALLLLGLIRLLVLSRPGSAQGGRIGSSPLSPA